MRSIVVVALLASLLAANHAYAQEQIVLETSSDQGTFTVEITWTPDDIGAPNTFDILFIEPETGEVIEGVIYDFSIYQEGRREAMWRDQTATQQEFAFDKAGAYEVRVEDIEGLGERVAIPIQVTPEFPVGAIALVAATLGAAVFAARNSNKLFRQ